MQSSLASHVASGVGSSPRPHDATFEAVYRVMVGFVRRVVCQQPIRPADRDDAVQDVFMVAYRRWGQLDSVHSLRAWLHGIAVRTCWNYQRAQRRWSLRFAPSYDGMEDRMDMDAPAADEELAHQEDLRQLGRAVEQLCEKHRDAILLSRIEGRSAMEVSNMTALSPNTIASRVRAALFELREALCAGEISPRGGAASRAKK